MADNRRVKMTKMLMKDALLELLDKKSLEKITVTDICECADVNRSTFYAYYDDISGLLMELEDDVFSNLPGSTDVPISDFYHRFLADLEEFFNYVYKNERLFRVLIVQRDNSSFNHRLINSVMEKYKKISNHDNQLLDRYEYVYCVSGVIGIMKEWITGGYPISTRQLAEIVFDMSAKATAK